MGYLFFGLAKLNKAVNLQSYKIEKGLALLKINGGYNTILNSQVQRCYVKEAFYSTTEVANSALAHNTYPDKETNPVKSDSTLCVFFLP